MAREFKVRFKNVEMIDGMDGLLEDTQVTKVQFSGDNDLKSLNNTFKDCPNLTGIDGDVNLKEVKEMDCMLEGTPAIDINLININKLESADNSLITAKTIVIKGNHYKKEALQNLLGSLDWLSEQYTFEDFVKDNIYINNEENTNENELYIDNSLERRNIGLEIIGETYNNQLKDGSVINTLKDWKETKIEENMNEITIGKTDTFVIDEIKGNTYQNLIEKNISNHLVEKKDFVINDKTTISLKNDESELFNITEVKGNTIKNLNTTENKVKITSNSFSLELTKKNNVIEANVDTIEINEILGNVENDSYVGNLYVNDNGDTILDENGNILYIITMNIEDDEKINKMNLLLPQPLRKVGTVSDRLYWDYKSECYYIEKNISDNITILNSSEIIKIPKMNKKIKLKIKSGTILTFDNVYPSYVKITNEQTTFNIEELKKETTYSIQFKAFGNEVESDITSNNLNDLVLILDDKVNTDETDIAISTNSIAVNCDKNIEQDVYCTLNFGKIFSNITDENWEFSCRFSVNSIKSNRELRLQCGNKEKQGFSVSTTPFVGTGTISISYNCTEKKYTIQISGAISYTVRDVAFSPNIENVFKILVKNCKITFSNISLISNELIYIGDGENRNKRIGKLNLILGESSTNVLPTNKDMGNYNLFIKTSSNLSNNYLEMFGDKIFIKDVLVIESSDIATQDYFKGTKEIGVFKDDSYILILTSNNYEEDWENL